ncbi:dUTP diphosphatase [Bacillus sp. 03113]|uniref:dUTP diphosphatase n=1 Tax=Bacillus sp. 03113 TaxID=2578211 RepID=UPI001142DE7E|nr:dUTP diphosphatase [Bacillus sp. 03113]
MNVEKLFSMQKALDQHIEKKHNLQEENLFNRKVLALLVEIGELANETRCFKFWSVKPSSEQSVILEEFVDGVHFILSLGLEKGFQEITEILASENKHVSITDQFLYVFEAIQQFSGNPSKDTYITMFQAYLDLAILLGFSHKDIEDAYMKKNEVNYERQKQGY